MLDYLNLKDHPDFNNLEYSTLLHYIIMHAETVHGKTGVYFSKMNKRYRINCTAMCNMTLLTATMLKEMTGGYGTDSGTFPQTIREIFREFRDNELRCDADSSMPRNYYQEKFNRIVSHQLANVHADIMTSYINMLKKGNKYIYAEWRDIDG